MATVDLGMSEAAFLDSCPRILMAELARQRKLEEQRWERERKHADYRAGIIAAAAANAGWGKREDGEPWTALHFFPDLAPEKEDNVPQLLGFVAALNARFGGRDLRRVDA